MIATTLAALLPLATAAAPVQTARWPATEGARAPSNAPAVPTTLAPMTQSLTALLDGGARIVTAYVADNGPVVTLSHQRKSVICILAGPPASEVAGVATSRCYRLN